MAALLASIATFVLGIVPASLLVLFALIVGLAPFFGLFQDYDFILWKLALGLVFGPVLSVMAVLGYMGLFEALGGPVTRRVAGWLAAGIVANVIGIGLVVLVLDPASPLQVAGLFLPPLLVGCAHLVRYLASSRGRRVFQ
jgi:hypothetical protein